MALTLLGFKRLEYNYYVFINHVTKVIIIAYVNDLLFIARNYELIT